MIVDRKDCVPEDTRSARLEATPEGVQAFLRSGFGLSVHWGLYAIRGRGEWAEGEARESVMVFIADDLPEAKIREGFARLGE